MQPLRYLFAGIAILFFAGVIYQVYLAGSAVFGAGQWADHAEFGYLVAIVPVLLIVGALLARAGRRTVWLTVAALVVAQVQTFLPWFRADVPWIAALHPVNAMLVFAMALVVARRAVMLVRTPSTGAAPAVDGAAQQA